MITAKNKQTTVTERQSTVLCLAYQYGKTTAQGIFEVANKDDFENVGQIHSVIQCLSKRDGFVRGQVKFSDAAINAGVLNGAYGNNKALWRGKLNKHRSGKDSIDMFNEDTPITCGHGMKEYRAYCKSIRLHPLPADVLHERFLNRL